jgi:integrase/recombinase XerD
MKNPDPDLFQMLHDYLTCYVPVERHMSPDTLRTYKQALNQYRLYLQSEKGIAFMDANFDSFARETVYGFLTWLRDENKSVETINNRLAGIKSFLKYCAERDVSLTTYYSSVSAIRNFRSTKVKKVDYLTENQLKVLFAEPDVTTRIGRRDRFIMIFSYETGCRMQELLNLKLKDIRQDSNGTIVRILGKGSKLRTVPLTDKAAGHLNAYLNEFHPERDNDEFLVFTIHDGRRTQMKYGAVDYLLKKYAGQICKRDDTFPGNLHEHMLRHSIAMAMLKHGVPLSYIKDFLGHSQIQTTTIYAHSDDEAIRQALDKVEHPKPPEKQPEGKRWKGKEAELLKYCGLTN